MADENRRPILAATKYSGVTLLDPTDPNCPDRMPFMAKTDRFGRVDDWDVPNIAEPSCRGGGTVDGPCGNLILGMEVSFDGDGSRIERPLKIRGSDEIAKKKFGRVSSYQDMQKPDKGEDTIHGAAELTVKVPAAGLSFKVSGSLISVGATSVLIVAGELALTVGTVIEVSGAEKEKTVLKVNEVDQVSESLCHVLCDAQGGAQETSGASEPVTGAADSPEAAESAYIALDDVSEDSDTESPFDDGLENLFILDAAGESGTAVPDTEDTEDVDVDPVDLLDL